MEYLRENISTLVSRRPEQFKMGLGTAAAMVPLAILILKPHPRELAIMIFKVFGTIPLAILSHFTREKALQKRSLKQTIVVSIFRVMIQNASLWRLRQVLPMLGRAVAFQKGYTSKQFNSQWQNETVKKTWKGIWVGNGVGATNVDDPRAFDNVDVVIIHVHGGGFTSGTATEGLTLFVELVKQFEKRHNIRAFVFSLDYFLAPEHRFPSARDQIIDIYTDHVLNKLQIPAQKIVFSGDSAGGNLALVAAIKIRDESHSRNVPLPSALILSSPWVSLLRTSASYTANVNRDFITFGEIDSQIENYIKNTGAKPTDPAISPLFAENFADLPPMVVAVGNHEMFNDDIRALVEKVKSAGVKAELVDNEIGVHDWLLSEDLAGGEKRWLDGIAKLVDFVVSSRR
ncbi:alpha/beta hydrolase fold-domain-containing protein [Endogone sp. FLAS-F59071]|nr:alpha/beta hydrolase fold-domain-containing protein [Endogone sp. FLAS-F59071]|eukprot:RUS22290.1 alpha/beta hydrolase fold-domain-containing protein [Endogone sp. FLAS-F59071]